MQGGAISLETFINILYTFDFQSVFKLILGFILTGIIGLERDSWNKPAGFRTHSLVGISAVLLVLCGEYLHEKYNGIDPSRIPAQLLSGIGFIGAGTILRDGFTVKGLTTASSLLAVTCIGLCIGCGFYFGGIVATIIIYLVLSYSYLLTNKLDHFNSSELIISIDKDFSNSISAIEQILDENKIEVKKIDKNNKKDNDEKVVKIHIKYKNDTKITKIITAISSLENISEVEES